MALAAVACSSSTKTIAALGDDDDEPGDASPAGSVDGTDGKGDGRAGDGSLASTDGALGSEADGGAEDASGTEDATGPGALGEDAGDVDAGPALCDPSTRWGTGVRLALSTSADDRFGAITPDELTLAWTIPAAADGGDAGAGGTVYWSDRTSTAVDFSAAETLSLSSIADDAVALGSDGLTMIVVRADRTGFVALTRASRSEAFAMPSEDDFSEVNPDRMGDDDDHVADPVIGGAATELFYSYIAGSASAPMGTTLQSASRSPGASRWLAQFTPANAAFAPSGAKLRRPTGLAVDQRTLFFWDEVSTVERAAYRDSNTEPFATFFDVGPQMYAAPNATCRRLYYSQVDGGSLDLYFADAL